MDRICGITALVILSYVSSIFVPCVVALEAIGR